MGGGKRLGFGSLEERDTAVIEQARQGTPLEQIAAVLGLSQRTVERIVRHAPSCEVVRCAGCNEPMFWGPLRANRLAHQIKLLGLPEDAPPFCSLMCGLRWDARRKR